MVEICGKCRNLSVALSNENRYFRNLTNNLGSSLVILCLLVYLAPVSHSATIPFRTMFTSAKRMSQTDSDSSEKQFPEYESILPYDEYPIVVPKRAALILDRILKEIELAKESNQLINDWSPISRRGNNKDKLYFRCYFNAVSCYKRK